VTYVIYVDGAAADTTTAAEGTSKTVTVTAGSHTFMVKTLNSSGTLSAGASVTWAAADRYTQDKNAPVTLRLYEFSAPAPLGSGLGLDGGPRNISAATGEGGVFSGIQLIMNTNTNNTFSIGPAAAFDEFANVDQFDQNVYVSDSSFAINSLNDWYSSKSLEDYIPKPLNNGNVFTFNNAQATGQMFFVRLGATAATAHYARVLIKSVSGNLLQGSGTSRYVEVEVSHQSVAGVPYAKIAVGRPNTPGSVASHQYGR
jgi:hypothetical protein